MAKVDSETTQQKTEPAADEKEAGDKTGKKKRKKHKKKSKVGVDDSKRTDEHD